MAHAYLAVILVAFSVAEYVAGKSAAFEDTSRDLSWNIHVTIHLFSGRRNPTWLIPDSHPDYNYHLEKMTENPSKPLPHQLGYKGFTLTHLKPGTHATSGGALNMTVTSYPGWELYLLEKSDLSEPMKKHVRKTIVQREGYRRRRSTYNNYLRYEDPYDTLLKPKTTVDPLAQFNPEQIERIASIMGIKNVFGRNVSTTPVPPGPTTFEPNKWNHFPVLETNNCYNYVTNEITFTMAQPGKRHHCSFPIENPRGRYIQKAAECDGLKTVIATSTYTLPTHEFNLVALVFWPPSEYEDLWDFHWYRLDNNKHWSHKPGKTKATNVDDRGRAITDPRHADRGPYTEFVAFMQTSPDRVTVA